MPWLDGLESPLKCHVGCLECAALMNRFLLSSFCRAVCRKTDRRSLATIYDVDAEAYDKMMISVCAVGLGVREEDVVYVWTDFGPEGPMQGSGGRRRLQKSAQTRYPRGTWPCVYTYIACCVRL